MTESAPPDVNLPPADPAPGHEYGQLEKGEVAAQINAHIKEKEQKHLAARIQTASMSAAARAIDGKKDPVKRNNYVKEAKKQADLAGALDAGIENIKVTFATEIAAGEEDSAAEPI